MAAVASAFGCHTGVESVGSRSTKPQSADLVDNEAAPSGASPSVAVSGILFSRSVRSSFASFTLAPTSWSSSLPPSTAGPSATTPVVPNETDPFPLLVRLQFMDNVKELRSFCRKQFKLGDRLRLLRSDKGRWEHPPPTTITGTSGKIRGDRNEADGDAGSPQPKPPSWSQQPRWVLDLSSTEEARNSIRVCAVRVWSMKDCQRFQQRYLSPPKDGKRKQQGPPSTQKQKRANGTIENGSVSKHDGGRARQPEHENSNHRDSGNGHHGGGKEKRLQANELIEFFVNLVASKVVVLNDDDVEDEGGATGSKQTSFEERRKHEERVREWFNRGDGVLDVAGGCGHVSMALGIQGISSTVVDARASVGKLPKRDRKLWKRSLRNQPPRTPELHGGPGPNRWLSGYEFCQPVVPAPAVVPFQSQQAWFGSKPIGYDASFRHPDEENIPLLVATAATKESTSSNGEHRDFGNRSKFTKEEDRKTTSENLPARSGDPVLRRSVSALVALHPDEATGEIVEQAVRHRIPFVVVPCCVFARLFPNRKTRDGRAVSSYEDLLDFLQEQDPSIQRTKLTFGGKNIALWSTFPDG